MTTKRTDAELIAEARLYADGPGLLPDLANALEARGAEVATLTAERDALLEGERDSLINGHDVRWWKAAWDKATDGKLDGYRALGAKVAAAEEARDTARAELARLVQEHGVHVNESHAEIRRLVQEITRLREVIARAADWHLSRAHEQAAHLRAALEEKS